MSFMQCSLYACNAHAQVCKMPCLQFADAKVSRRHPCHPILCIKQEPLRCKARKDLDAQRLCFAPQPAHHLTANCKWSDCDVLATWQ